MYDFIWNFKGLYNYMALYMHVHLPYVGPYNLQH